MSGWIHDAPPPEWKEGMILIVEGYDGALSIDVIGSCVLTTEWSRGLRDYAIVPGTESDREGLGTDHWQWLGDKPKTGRSYEPVIRAWHPGVSEHIHAIDSLPWLHEAEVLDDARPE